MAVKTDLHAAMSPERIGALTGTIDGAAASFTTGRLWHVDVTASNSGSATLAASVNAAIGTTTHHAALTFNATNLTYTLAGNATFSATLGSALAGALGLATSLSGAASYTSTARPLYVIRPLIAPNALASGFDGRSAYSGKYKPSDRITVRTADDGTSQFSVSPTSLPTYEDWTHRFERDAPLFDGGAFSSGSAGHAMMTEDVTATMPWSWEHFFDCVRAEEFFAFASQTNPTSAATATVGKMRVETSSFYTAARARGGPDTPYWDVSVKMLRTGNQ